MEAALVNGEDKLCQMAGEIGLFSYFCADLFRGGEVSFVWRFLVLALRLSGSPLRLLAGGEPVAFAVHLQDVDMMGERVEQGAGEPFRAAVWA